MVLTKTLSDSAPMDTFQHLQLEDMKNLLELQRLRWALYILEVINVAVMERIMAIIKKTMIRQGLGANQG